MNSLTIHFVAAALLFVSEPAATVLFAEEPLVIGSLKKNADSLAIKSDKTGCRLEIDSATGIGSITIKPSAGSWPNQVTLAINLKSLEGLDITTQATRVHTALGGKTVEVYRKSNTGKWEADKAGKAPTIKITQAHGVIEIVIPASLLTDKEPFVEIQWVDIYR